MTTPADRSINYVEFPAADLDTVRAFYGAVFAWTFTPYGPDYLAFKDRALEGGFYRAPLRSVAAQGAALVVFYAVDLEATRDAVLAAGGTLAKPIFAFPGGRRFHFTDPAGNELAVWSDRDSGAPA